MPLNPERRIPTLLILFFFGLVFAYAGYEARNIMRGPEISVGTPEEVVRVQSPLVRIAGTAERIVDLTLDGRAVPVTEAGAFAEEVLLAPGYNRIRLVAHDKAGRVSERVLHLVYTAPATETVPLPEKNTP